MLGACAAHDRRCVCRRFGRNAALAGDLGSGFDQQQTTVVQSQNRTIVRSDTRQYCKAFIGIFVRLSAWSLMSFCERSVNSKSCR